MTDIRDLQLLVSLARHKHFSRAADDCGISQPAFSARIRKLEDSYALPLVRRGNKFMGFTREGEVVLKWARKLLADVDGMQQEIGALHNDLSGKLRLGAIPTAMPFAAKVSAHLRRRHPNLSIEIHSLSTRAIEIRLNDFSLDAGMMYVADADPATTETLYEESYVLVVPHALAPRQSGTASWAEAATLPLCLLTGDMRNRQFLDGVFRGIAKVPTVVMEASGFMAVLTQVITGTAATIAPKGLVETFLSGTGTVQLALDNPVASQAVGLSIKEQTPIPPMIHALRRAVRDAL
jgi:DNA-binding transcriptional LysR family regulator